MGNETLRKIAEDFSILKLYLDSWKKPVHLQVLLNSRDVILKNLVFQFFSTEMMGICLGSKSVSLGWCTWCKLSWDELSEQESLQGEKAGWSGWLCWLFKCSRYGVFFVRRKLWVLWCAEAVSFESHEVICTVHQFRIPVRKRLKFLQLNWSSHRFPADPPKYAIYLHRAWLSRS